MLLLCQEKPHEPEELEVDPVRRFTGRSWVTLVLFSNSFPSVELPTVPNQAAGRGEMSPPLRREVCPHHRPGDLLHRIGVIDIRFVYIQVLRCHEMIET